MTGRRSARATPPRRMIALCRPILHMVAKPAACDTTYRRLGAVFGPIILPLASGGAEIAKLGKTAGYNRNRC